eukprot:6510280-Pyramimonas_sp.AAC.1
MHAISDTLGTRPKSIASIERSTSTRLSALSFSTRSRIVVLVPCNSFAKCSAISRFVSQADNVTVPSAFFTPAAECWGGL